MYSIQALPIERCPTFRGPAKREIIRLSSAVLVAITWLIKRNPKREYKFQEGWTHSEDVAFFLSISEDGLYDFTEGHFHKYY